MKRLLLITTLALCTIILCAQGKNDKNIQLIKDPFAKDIVYLDNNPEAWLSSLDKPASSAEDSFNSLRRVILKKNFVEVEEGGQMVTKNLMTQKMFEDSKGNPLVNTIFVVQHEFELVGDITIPKNCVLEFDGGGIYYKGNSDVTINLQNAVLSGIPKFYNCIVINPNNNKLFFSWLCIGNDATYNTNTLTWLATKNIDWVVDVDCEVNNSITVTHRINISSTFVDTSSLKTISFPNSAGFVFSANPYHEQTCIENFILIAKGVAIKYTGYAYNTYIKNLRVQSDESNAISFANNFQVHIMDCWLYAPNGYCVDNLKSTTSSITRVSIGACKAAYHNCITTWISCNGVWNSDIHGNPGTTKNWYLWDSPTANYNIPLTFINCNIESISEIPILSTSTVANVFFIKGINTNIYSYKDTTTGKREYPIIKVGAIRSIEGVHFSGGIDNFADNVYPIMLSVNIGDKYNPIIKFDFATPVYVKALNMEGEYTSNIYAIPTVARPSIPLEGYTYYDTTLHKQVWYNGTNWVDAIGNSVQ